MAILQVKDKNGNFINIPSIIGKTGPKGEDYIITDKDYEKMENQVKEDIQPILDEAKENSETALSISKGANQALSFGDYATMISVFNNLNNDIYRTGQNILIVTLNVPDLWISAIEEESTPYTFVDDETFTNELKTNGIVKVGYYVLSALETQKVDLTEYVKKTDYANNSTGGVVKVGVASTGLAINNAGLLTISCAEKSDIDKKQSYNKPITPIYLEHAVKSIGDGYYATETYVNELIGDIETLLSEV